VIRLGDPEATAEFGKAVAKLLRPGDVVALFGTLGAGKTTLTRGVLEGLGHEGDVQSPTFPIVQVYEGGEMRLPIWHVDLYRIEDESEVEELALDEARAYASLIIEWPERLGALLWHDSLRLHLSVLGEGERALTADVPPAWRDRWPPR